MKVTAIVGAFAGACMAASIALASPPPPPDYPSFPMKSETFRPLFAKLVAQFEAMLATLPPEQQAKGRAGIEQMKLRASRATEDGVVTSEECDWILG